MKVILEEQVLVYREEQYEQWKRGNRFLLPDFIEPHRDYLTQPSYHFGEVFVIDTYHRLYGWKGFRFYALGMWEPNNPKYARSREVIADLFPEEKLSRFRELRREQDKVSGTGEPDVMLLNGEGKCLFLEVKKGSDKISEAQLTCLAQIRSVLGAEVGVVYLREENQKYIPKRYELDLAEYKGRLL